MKKLRITRSLVPNLLTLVNLFCGFVSIVYASEGLFLKSSLFILIAAIFDMLDGFTARLINAASEFGSELDSLCDVVSFGVAPSFLVYQSFFIKFEEIGILLASFPALAGASRLARFNVQLVSLEDKRFFKGLPIPSGALTLISYLIFYHNDLLKNFQFNNILMILIVIIVSLAMISTIRFSNIPKISITGIKQNPIFSAALLIAIMLSVITNGYAIFPILMIYIIFSIINHIFYTYNQKNLEDDDVDIEDNDNSELI